MKDKKEPESNAWKKRKKMAAEMLEKEKMKDKLGPYHIDDIMRMMLDIFPEMEVGEDNDGQLVVYTGWEACSSDGFYAPMKEE